MVPELYSLEFWGLVYLFVGWFVADIADRVRVRNGQDSFHIVSFATIIVVWLPAFFIGFLLGALGFRRRKK